MKSVAILIPAYNEEQALADTLARVSRLNPPADEVVLVDGGSDDKTVEIAVAYGVNVILSPSRGRARQINYGVEHTESEFVCILHADSILPNDAVSEIRNALADNCLALGSFHAAHRWATGHQMGYHGA